MLALASLSGRRTERRGRACRVSRVSARILTPSLTPPRQHYLINIIRQPRQYLVVYIDAVSYAKERYLYTMTTTGKIACSYRSAFADSPADGRHERHMMRQRGAGYKQPDEPTMNTHSYTTQVLDPFLQTLASSSRPVPSNCPLLLPPNHHHQPMPHYP